MEELTFPFEQTACEAQSFHATDGETGWERSGHLPKITHSVSETTHLLY